MNPSPRFQQILDVLARIRAGGPASQEALQMLRKRATHAVAAAQPRPVDERTVADKCWRGLWVANDEDFHIGDFDRLVWAWLHDQDSALRTRMERCTRGTTREADLAAISAFFEGSSPPSAGSVQPQPVSGKVLVDHVTNSLSAEGLHFTREQIADFYLCIRTKPFVLFAGVSGTGKSLLARRFAQACSFEDRCTLIPVRPDWSDPGELIGYRNLKDQFVPGRLVRAVVEATLDPARPSFVILDEMNLARVEHYFADVLSILETRDRRISDDAILTDPLLSGVQPDGPMAGEPEVLTGLARSLRDHGRLGIPPNLSFIGTVNMDESTHPFSRKVLDRAMTIEFGDVDLRQVRARRDVPVDRLEVAASDLAADRLTLAEVWENQASRFEVAIDLLSALNKPLARCSSQVGYRVRDELCLYLHHNAEQQLLDATLALDLATHHKILPRLQGGEELRSPLGDIRKLVAEKNLVRCVTKIDEMQRRLTDTGYTAFWS